MDGSRCTILGLIVYGYGLTKSSAILLSDVRRGWRIVIQYRLYDPREFGTIRIKEEDKLKADGDEVRGDEMDNSISAVRTRHLVENKSKIMIDNRIFVFSMMNYLINPHPQELWFSEIRSISS